MTSRVRPRAAAGVVLLACFVVAGCGGSTSGSAPRPSPSPVPEVALPDFNSRLGSNRLAAEASAGLGRVLFTKGEYWEVYVRTTPATLPGKYDPADPAASGTAAAAVTQADVIIATESGAAIKDFGSGGEAHEREVLSELDAALRKAFPSMTVDNMKVFYGESFQHGAATFTGGTLTQYTVRKLG